MDPQNEIPAVVEYPNKWAFIVGVTDYQNIRKLDYSGNDAEELARTLKDELQFKNIVELHSKAATQPERDNILNELDKLCTQSGIGADDLLLFFFSGHGVIFEGDKKDYILPTRAKLGTLRETGIQVETVVEYLKKSDCKNIVMFIDACREMITGEKAAKGATPIGEASKEALEESGIITFFSCGPTDLSYEIEALKHSSFTWCLLEAIRSKEQQTVDRLDRYLRKEVGLLNEKYEKGAQKPYLIVKPQQKVTLPIFASLQQQSAEAQKDFERMIELLAALYFDEKLEAYYYEKALEVIDRVRQGNVEQARLLQMIEDLIQERMKPSTYMVTWKALERSRFGGSAIQKPKDLGPIR